MSRNCSEPKYVFQNFDNLSHCYDDFGGIVNTSNPFTRLVNACINDYCNNTFPELGGCGKWTGSTELNFSITSNFSVFVGYTSFNNDATCDGVKGEINSDIAGPGVFSSYMIQLVMILYLYFFLRLSREGPSIVSYFSKRKKFKKPLTGSEAKTKPSRLFDRHNAVLKHTLVEFQEAQCFFMLASQIAVLWSIKHNAAFKSYTLRSLLENNSVSGMVSSTGILPVIIGMWTLQKIHDDEFPLWNFILSIVTVILSEVALYQTQQVPGTDQIVSMNYNDWPASCGFLAPPLVYCGLSTEESYTQVLTRGGPIFFLQWSNPYCLVVFALVIILWISNRIAASIDASSFPRAKIFLERVSTTEPVLNSNRKTKRWIEWASAIVTVLVEIGLIAAMVMDITAFDGFDYLNLIDWSAWSFGQIVAITLWLPVVSKYIYWLIFGTDAYSKARIPSPYKIIKRQQSNTSGGDYGNIMSNSGDEHVGMP